MDEDLAEEARLARCLFCKGPLHQAHYPRKPRGVPLNLDVHLGSRFSFCCYLCRKRLTPPSFRFLGRKVYLGGILVLVSAMLSGDSPQRRKKLRAICGADARTLSRWRTWWADTFSQTSVWRGLPTALALRGDSAVPIPLSLLRGLRASSLLETLTGALRLLLPLTGGGGSG